MTSDQRKFSCIILAGGQGRRVGGQDKGLLEYNHKKLISHVIAAVKPQTNEIIISANRNIEIYKQYADQVISDTTAGYQGPLAGLYATLTHCKQDWVFVVPCDMPFLTTDVFHRLAAANDNRKIYIAASGERLQPVFLLQRSLHASIGSALDQGELRLMRWISALKPGIIRFPENRTFSNFNTRESLSSPPLP